MNQISDEVSTLKNPHNSTEEKGSLRTIHEQIQDQNPKSAPFCEEIPNQVDYELSMEISQDVFFVEDNQSS